MKGAGSTSEGSEDMRKSGIIDRRCLGVKRTQCIAMEMSWGRGKGAGSLYSGHVGKGRHMLFIESQASLIPCTAHATLGLFNTDQ